MRVLVDTSVYIAYLLNPGKDSFVSLLLDRVADGHITLLRSEPLLDEIERTIRKKEYLRSVITGEQLSRFIHLLKLIAEEIPLITQAIPRITRDLKDDYLIAYAVLGGADYLISVDKDLLVIKEIQGVKIVHTAEYRQVLRK